jgi:hypothetical protein
MPRVTRFGVELEICYRFDDDCLKGDAPADVSRMLFVDKFKTYLKSILLTSNNLPYILRKYRYIAVSDEIYDKTIYDLENPEKEPVEYKNASKELRTLVDEYRIPIFADDLTVECGDTGKQYRAKGVKVPTEKSMRIECITPILSVEGEITEAKVEAALDPMLSFFGLDRAECFFANSTTGFHVNVSLSESSNGAAFNLSSKPFRKLFLERYGHYENKKYNTVRSHLREQPGKEEGPLNAEWAARLAGPFREKVAKGNSKELETFLNLKEKPAAVKVKDNSVFEFRLFQAEVEKEKLFEYTFAGLHLLNTIYDESLRKLKGGSRRKGRTHGRRLLSLRVRHTTRRRRQ